MSKRNPFQYIVLAATVLLSLLSFFFLPENVAVQWNASGASNFLPRYVAALLPTAICLIILLFRWSKCRSSTQTVPDKLWDVFSCLGLAVGILLLILN